MKALANEVISDVTNRGKSWTIFQKEATFVTVAAELQGAIATIAPYGFKSLIVDTAYDRTSRRPLFGPRSAQLWQESEALPQTGPFYSYRIWKGNFYLQPAPPAGLTIAFEYASDMAILAPDGVSWKKRFSADDDKFALDDDILLTGLRWKWKREQGITYSQEKLDFEELLANAMGNTADLGPLSLEGSSGQAIRPGIFVPAGNWPL
jgi:hypothetical protein